MGTHPDSPNRRRVHVEHRCTHLAADSLLAMLDECANQKFENIIINYFIVIDYAIDP